MSNFPVDIEPEILIWARESLGLSQDDAAKKLRVSLVQLGFWEVGASSPTLAQLRRMVEVYKRPLAVFFLSTPPRDFDAMKDFRLLPEHRGKPWSPELHEAFRRVMRQREIAVELAERSDATPPPLDLRLSLNDHPEDAGERIRLWLGVSVDAQISWKDQHESLARWIDHIEARGVLVAQVSRVSIGEMRGCSISDQPFPIIILNGADSPRGRVFTLLHELAHILLHKPGLCDLQERGHNVGTSEQRVEVFCNHVAAATLMPQQAMLSDPVIGGEFGPVNWTDQALISIAERFGVSSEAVLRRLVTLNRASMSFYLNRRESYLREHETIRAERRNGGPTYYQMKLRNLGRRYVSEVIQAYRRRDINSAELVDYLDIRIDRLPKLVDQLQARV